MAKAKIDNQQIESAVLKYQKAISEKNVAEIENAYKNVCEIYNPNIYIKSWYEQYHYLYDTRDDFDSDYFRTFVTVLKKWKPRETRLKSRYDGTGDFKNYFIGSLTHLYINLIKADQAGKRNLFKKCPVCETWVNPLSTHVKTKHPELLWSYLKDCNIEVNNLNKCPFCDNFKIPKTTQEKDINSVVKLHLLSKHSNYLFQKFNDLYPDDVTLSPKSVSIYIQEDGEELDLADTFEKNNFMNGLMSQNLSELQMMIVNKVMSGNIDLKYDKNLYSCTLEDFQEAVEGLQDAIIIAGGKA